MERTVDLIGAPTDFGANRRGVDMGPSAIRYAGLLQTLDELDIRCDRDTNITVPPVEPDNGTDRQEIHHMVEALSGEVQQTLQTGRFPLVLGGDHSISIGSLSGIDPDRETGVLWFDAHADFNTPSTSPSGNVHGMPLAAVLGRGGFDDVMRSPAVREEHVVLVGVRSIDDGEERLLRDSNVTVYTMADIDRRGIASVAQDAVAEATQHVDHLHVSLDMDWLDPEEAPGVGTPVHGGVTYREAHLALEIVAQQAADTLGSMDVVEVNPVLDRENKTAELAVDLVASVFGRQIY